MDGAICGCGSRVSRPLLLAGLLPGLVRRIVLLVLLVLALAFGPGWRIGEATNPGPAADLDDPEGGNWPEEEDAWVCDAGPAADGPHEFSCLDDPEADIFADLDCHLRDLDSYAAVPEFQPASKFTGSRTGMAFKLGALGLGYYRDHAGWHQWTAEGNTGFADEPVELPVPGLYTQPWQGWGDALRGQDAGEPAERETRPSCATETNREVVTESESEEEIICIEGRRRRRRRETWEFETMNATCENSARARLKETPADIVCVQEHRKRSDELEEATRLACRAGWKAAYDPALATVANGSSGGTGVVARDWVGTRAADALPAEVEWPPTHRFSLRWVDAVVKGGILVASVYLETGSGYGGANIGILNMIGQVLRAYARPFILGGEWQMDQAVLAASGWLRAIGGTAVAPADEQFTCVSSRSASTIDYFVVADALISAVRGVWVDSDCTTIKTHHPVRMQVDGTARGNMVQRFRRPCAFPAQRPIGCDPEPPDYGNAIDTLNAANSAEQLNDGFVMWIQTAERELAARHGLLGNQRYAGRGEAYRVVTVSACGQRGDGRPKSTGAATMYRWLGGRLLELGHLKYGEAAPTAARLQHAAMLVRRLQRYRCPFAEPPALWFSWCDYRPFLELATWDSLCQAAGMLHDTARHIEHDEARLRAAAWKNWAAVTAMADGARLGHRWTKPVPPWTPSEVTASGSLETAQETADRQAGDWHQLWGVGGQTPQLSWHDPPECEDVQVPTVEELRETSKTFSRFTALGSDDLHPKHVGTLCDASLEGFRALLAAMLRMFEVPRAIALLLVILLEGHDPSACSRRWSGYGHDGPDDCTPYLGKLSIRASIGSESAVGAVACVRGDKPCAQSTQRQQGNRQCLRSLTCTRPTSTSLTSTCRLRRSNTASTGRSFGFYWLCTRWIEWYWSVGLSLQPSELAVQLWRAAALQRRFCGWA